MEQKSVGDLRLKELNLAKFKKRVMRRIYLLWMLGRIKSPIFIELLLLLLIFSWQQTYVNFSHIVKNIATASLTFSWVINYVVEALTEAELATKVLFSAQSAILLLLFGTLLRRLKNRVFKIEQLQFKAIDNTKFS